MDLSQSDFITITGTVIALVVTFVIAQRGRKETAKKLKETTKRLQEIQAKVAEEQRESTKEMIDRAAMVITTTTDKRFLETKKSIRWVVRKVILPGLGFVVFVTALMLWLSWSQ